jgi:hypothetical protein
MSLPALDQEKAERDRLTQSCVQIADVSVDSLVRADELGTSLNFGDGIELFRRIVRAFKDLRDSNLDGVPLATLQELNRFSDQVQSSIQAIRAFNPAQGNPVQARTQMLDKLAQVYQEFFPSLASVISYAIRKGTDFEKLESEASKLVADMKALGDVQKAEADKTASQMKEIVDQVRRSAAEVGVTQHNVHFRDQAAEHLGSSDKWLKATLVFGSATLFYGIVTTLYFLFWPPTLTPSQSIQVAVSKLILFSVLSFATVWTGRIYKAHWHNYIVNKHRQNALSTFETFVKAASDDQTKNAVLLQATQSIFSQTHSGFSTTESDGGGPTQILELVRSVTGSTAKAS